MEQIIIQWGFRGELILKGALMMNLAHLYRTAAKHWPNNIAVIDGAESVSFKEFNGRANRCAWALKNLGIKKGERVALLMHNCYQYLEARAALEKSGIVYVPVNTLLSEIECLYILNDSGVSAVLCGEEFLERMTKIKNEIPSLQYIVCITGNKNSLPAGIFDYNDLLAQSSAEEPAIETHPHDLCSLNYTSGTTGRPKGVMLTQDNWINTYRNMLVDRDIREDDVLGHVGPLTHASGSYFMPYYLRGASSFIVPGGFNVKKLLKAIDKKKITAFSCVPTMVVSILCFLKEHPLQKYDFSGLRNVAYGAAPMPTEIIKEAINIFGPVFTQNYGLTEAYMTICFLPKEEHLVNGSTKSANRLKSIGRPYTFVEVRIVGEDGLDLPPGEVGEIIVRSPHVMQAYWRLPAETAETLRNGWLFTGDLGTFDEEGYVYLVGRKKDMIISGGFNIYPKEVENVLAAHPDVREVAVFGVPEEKWGEIVVAAVSIKENKPDEGELLQYCKQRLGFKSPKSIMFVEEMPLTTTGKINKKTLKKLYTRR